MKKKIAIGGIIVGAFALGMYVDRRALYKSLIDIYESNTKSWKVVEDPRTGLLYEIVAECVGD